MSDNRSKYSPAKPGDFSLSVKQVVIGGGGPTGWITAALLANTITSAQLDEFLANIYTLIHRTIPTRPGHTQFTAEHCRAETPT